MNEHWTNTPIRRGLVPIKPILKAGAGMGFVGGSYAAFMAYLGDNPIMPNDVDFFATSLGNAQKTADNLVKTKRYSIETENDVVYNLIPIIPKKHNWFPVADPLRCAVQIVKPHPDWKTFPDDILNSFDLNISRAILVGSTILCDSDVIAYGHFGKVLRINNPLKTMKRIAKYAERGVVFSDHEMLKVFAAWDVMAADRKKEMLANAKSQAEYEEHGGAGLCEDYTFDFDDDDYFEGE